jgi:hypothetical protein
MRNHAATRLRWTPWERLVSSVLEVGRTSQEYGARTMLEAKIINRGRGPEIAGTRITVYDILDYH